MPIHAAFRPAILITALAAGSLAIAAHAASSSAAPATQPGATAGHLGGKPAGPAAETQPTSKQVMDHLLKQRQERQNSSVVTPDTSPAVEYVPGRVEAEPGSDKLNPEVLGVAPGQKPPHLLREGTFIINRRGRMVRSKDGSHELFVFEADSKSSPETPMILQACRKLESMEKVVQQRGGSVVFILSGQVHTYHGANYLMPTMMKIAPPRNNLGG